MQQPRARGPRPQYVPGEVIVKFRPGLAAGVRAQAAQGAGASIKRDLLLKDYAVVSFPADQDVLQKAAALRRNPNIELAEPNFYAYADSPPGAPNAFTPNDPGYPYQWHFPKIQMSTAWDISNGSGVIVAVVDTGVAYTTGGGFTQAPDLANTSFVAGYDFVNNDAQPSDDNGHGTHVAGTIAQSTNNNLGVAGIAYGASLMPVKVCNSNGSCAYDSIADGITWAADHGAKVINLSLGGPAASILESAVNYAVSKLVTVVAASGNDGINGVGYPAAYPNVIAVGATRYDNTRSYYSNYGPALDLAAPGGDLTVDQNGDFLPDGVFQQTSPNFSYCYLIYPSDDPNFPYCFLQGTSMATPHVSGVAALLLSKNKAVTPAQIQSILQTTALDLGPAGRDDQYGYGLVQARSALDYLLANYTVYNTYLPIVMKGYAGGW